MYLTGTVNPTLEMGPAKLQIGTSATPVLANNLYSAALADKLGSVLTSESGKNILLGYTLDETSKSRNQIETGMTNSIFVTVSNEDFILPNGSNKFYIFNIQNVNSGLLNAPFAVMAKGSIVNTPKELVNATKNIRPVVLVYRLDTSDLRNLKLTPVPASQLRGVQAR